MKKGQAAMEFLMTYGWAILVVLAAIGALAYFGVLSPEKQFPEVCMLPPGIACLGHSYNNGNIEVSIQNSGGYDFKDVAVGIQSTQCNSMDASYPTLVNMENHIYRISCPGLSGKFQGKIYFSYTNKDSGLQHNETGIITLNLK
jgi:hypothetical protein